MRRSFALLAAACAIVLGAGPRASVAQGIPKPVPPQQAKPAVPPKKATPPPKPGEWRDLGFVTLSAAYQGAPASFGYTMSPAEYAYAEAASLRTGYHPDGGPLFDGGAGFRVWRNLAVGGAVSVFSRSSSVEVDGTIPHPLYLRQPRAVTGSFDSLRREVGVHVQATWVVPAGRRMLVFLSGGPSYFVLRQDLATTVQVSQVYPYDSASVSGAQAAANSKGGIGFNVGADAAWYFSRSAGVGGFVRYSRARISMPVPDGSAVTDAGGVQAGFGVRLRVGSTAPKAPPARGPVRK
jgi:hypothetical protein